MATSARTRLLSMAVLALVFVSGAVVGAALDRRWAGAAEVSSPAGDDENGDRDEGDERDRDGRRAPMYERVGLKPGQRERIDSVLAHHRTAMKALNDEFSDDYQAMRDLQKQYREAYSPRYWEIVESTRAANKAVFDGEQAARYDSLLVEFDLRRRSERADTTRD
jgi:hypothetical protein